MPPLLIYYSVSAISVSSTEDKGSLFWWTFDFLSLFWSFIIWEMLPHIKFNDMLYVTHTDFEMRLITVRAKLK